MDWLISLDGKTLALNYRYEEHLYRGLLGKSVTRWTNKKSEDKLRTVRERDRQREKDITNNRRDYTADSFGIIV